MLSCHFLRFQSDESHSVNWLTASVAVNVDEDVCNLVEVLRKLCSDPINLLAVLEVPALGLGFVVAFDGD